MGSVFWKNENENENEMKMPTIFEMRRYAIWATHYICGAISWVDCE